MTTAPLHTTVRGPETSPATILWIHGVDSDSHVWDRSLELVSDHLGCLTIDLPGHGGSASPTEPAAYARSAVLADLDAVVDGVRADRPLHPIVLVGHSLGGYLGLAHAITRPNGARHLDALVLVSTGPGFRDPEAMQSWNARVESNSGNYSIPEVAASIAFHTDSMVIDRLSELTLPVQLVVGDGDRAFLGANDYLEKKIAHSRRTTVEGGRHFVMRSHPEAVANAVDAAVADLLAE